MEVNAFDIGKKLWWHLDSVLQVVQDKPTWPIHFGIDPSNVCNHDCAWCTYTDILPNKKQLDRAVILDALKTMARNGTKAVTWSGGGEPTTNPALVEAMEYAYECGLEQGLYTNGQLLDQRHIDVITKGFAFVRFSLDSATDETYVKAHRVQSGVFAKVINNIRSIVEQSQKTTIGVSMIVHETNYHDIVKLAKLMKEIGVHYVEYKPAIFAEHQGAQQYAAEWWESEVFPRLEEAVNFSTEKTKILPVKHKFIDITTNDFGRSYCACLSQNLQGLINADGTLYVCCNQRGNDNFKLGNLYEDTLDEIWLGETRQKVLAAIDVQKCPPNCKGHEANKVLWHAKHPNLSNHPNFI